MTKMIENIKNQMYAIKTAAIAIFIALSLGLGSIVIIDTIFPSVEKIYLTELITEETAEDIYKILLNTRSNVVHIYASSPGGAVMAGQKVVFAIKMAKDRGIKIKYFVMNEAASYAALLSCYADEVYIDDSAFILFHNPRFYKSRTEFDIVTEDNKNKNITYKLVYAITQVHYKHCGLDAETIKRLNKGEDLFYVGPERKEIKL